MGQKKLVRFAELKTFSNVLQYPEGMKGKWNEFFKNNNPITLELACGKGEYAVGLGQLYPQKNFAGIDQKGNRIWVGAKKALQLNLKNVTFLRIQIDRINEYFAAKEVNEIQYEHKTVKSEVMFRSKKSELLKAVEPLGLKELTSSPAVLKTN